MTRLLATTRGSLQSQGSHTIEAQQCGCSLQPRPRRRISGNQWWKNLELQASISYWLFQFSLLIGNGWNSPSKEIGQMMIFQVSQVLGIFLFIQFLPEWFVGGHFGEDSIKIFPPNFFRGSTVLPDGNHAQTYGVGSIGIIFQSSFWEPSW